MVDTTLTKEAVEYYNEYDNEYDREDDRECDREDDMLPMEHQTTLD